MSTRIKLHDIPTQLNYADPVPCTVDGLPHDAEFLRYGEDADGNEWRNNIWVEVYGLVEAKSGSVRRDMFGTFKTEFTVNADRTAYTAVWK